MKQKRLRIILLAIALLLGCSMGGTEKQSEATEQPADLPEETSEPEVKDPVLNPYFTCTGTEYGPYPILPPEERRAEAEALFAEYREAFELAAKEWPDFDRFYVINGKAYVWDPEQNGNATVDPATLPESVQALVALSEETGIGFYRTGPEPVFTEDAAPFFEVNLPMAIDTTMYQDPGTLYAVWLIYTENTAEQIRYSELEPLAENWYIEIYFYAY